MAADLTGRRVALLAAKGVEQVELEGPRQALTDAGATVTLVSLEPGEIQGVNGDIHPGTTYPVDAVLADVTPEDFDALVMPGGAVNPDTMRQDPAAVAFVRAMVTSGRPVAAICHAPWMLVEADVVRGRTLTSYPSIATDIRNAGGTWVDEQTVHDGNLLTSRNPDDVPAFSAAAVEHVAG